MVDQIELNQRSNSGDETHLTLNFSTPPVLPPEIVSKASPPRRMKFQSPMAFKFHPNAPRCPLITALCSFPHESQQIPLDLWDMGLKTAIGDGKPRRKEKKGSCLKGTSFLDLKAGVFFFGVFVAAREKELGFHCMLKRKEN
ncbi:hypothetical protein COLO4_37680 [Corchorus olitorius]|uniref:Uncharacterized protein n=1 Tax=Corchorus olitorius TaxID=93759 RepID=A0A1R3G042_9ROSI|nr:hypothetical protein COLO4_37680 [Corchorus olitorius]